MKEFKCRVRKYVEGWVESYPTISPIDYIGCDSLDTVKALVKLRASEMYNKGDIDVQYTNGNVVEIPDAFYKEWADLKTQQQKFLCSLAQYISGKIDGAYELDPKDFLSCKNEDELQDAVRETIFDRILPRNLVIGDVLDEELKIPNEFIKMWKALKNESNL